MKDINSLIGLHIVVWLAFASWLCCIEIIYVSLI